MQACQAAKTTIESKRCTQTAPGAPQNETKAPQDGPKKVQGRHKNAPRGTQESLKSKPNRRTKTGLNQDDPKNVLDPPRGRNVQL